MHKDELHSDHNESTSGKDDEHHVRPSRENGVKVHVQSWGNLQLISTYQLIGELHVEIYQNQWMCAR